jgi:hypothetical protein
MRTIPPTTPITIFTIGSLAIVSNPRAKSIMRENSTIVCAIEKIRPDLAPCLAPCETVAKNKGPGARAPDAVIIIMVATKPRISIIKNGNNIFYNNLL